MNWIGTSGFQYPEWKGKFFPQTLPTARMLEFYAERFNSTESNYTFRRIPSAETLHDWAARTPARFRFSLKAPQEMTHLRRLRRCRPIVQRFWSRAEDLEKKLGAILFQLPPFLHEDTPLLVDFLALLPKTMKAAFEFRHESWFCDKVFDALKQRNAALCLAESEKLSTPIVYTASFAYYRLRDERYTARDLQRWARAVENQPARIKTTFVYFKHEEKALGPEFAATFQKLTL